MNMINTVAAHHGVLANSSGALVAKRGDFALKSNGTAYVDTLILADQSHDISIRVKFSQAAGKQFIFGGSSSGYTSLVGKKTDASGDPFISWGTGEDYATGWPTLIDGAYHTVQKEGSDILLDSNRATRDSLPDSSTTSTLFRSKPSTNIGPCDIPLAVIWDSAARLTHLLDAWAIPTGYTPEGSSLVALSPEMYDAVSDSFLPRIGTFTFEALP